MADGRKTVLVDKGLVDRRRRIGPTGHPMGAKLIAIGHIDDQPQAQGGGDGFQGIGGQGLAIAKGGQRSYIFCRRGQQPQPIHQG